MIDDITSDRWAPIRTAGRFSAYLRTYLTVLFIAATAELIRMITPPLGPGQVVLLPLLYAAVLGLALSYNVLGSVIEPLRSTVDESVNRIASPFLVVALMPLGMRYGTFVTPSFYDLVVAGSAFVLQEFRNLGTILITPPLVLLLSLKRESIGAVVDIIREPTLSVITDECSIESPEGRGAFGTYIIGTALGAVFFDLFGGFAPAAELHPLAFSTACGMESASMIAACSTPLTTVVDGAGVAEDQVLSFATASNLLTGITGLYMVIFVGPLIITHLYTVLTPMSGHDIAATDGGE